MRAGVELEIECAARIARKKAGWKPAVRNVAGAVKSDEGAKRLAVWMIPVRMASSHRSG